MLNPVVQLEVVVLQRRGGAWREPAVGACAVEEQPRADRTQQDAQGAHHDDGEEDGVQRVQPGVVLVFLWHQGDGGGVHVGGGGGGEGGRPSWEDVVWREDGTQSVLLHVHAFLLQSVVPHCCQLDMWVYFSNYPGNYWFPLTSVY